PGRRDEQAEPDRQRGPGGRGPRAQVAENAPADPEQRGDCHELRRVEQRVPERARRAAGGGRQRPLQGGQRQKPAERHDGRPGRPPPRRGGGGGLRPRPPPARAHPPPLVAPFPAEAGSTSASSAGWSSRGTIRSASPSPSAGLWSWGTATANAPAAFAAAT